MSIPIINHGKSSKSMQMPRANGSAGMWLESTIQSQEMLASKYQTRDPEMWKLYPRILGVVADCINKNATVCASMPIRLYRVVNESSKAERSNYPGRRKGHGVRTRVGQIKSGVMGQKAAMVSQMGGDVEEVMEHPIKDFLMRPNPVFSSDSMVYTRFSFKWGMGEYYDFIEDGSDGMPLNAFPLYPQYTTIVFDESGFIRQFNYGRDMTNPAEFDPANVIFYRHRPSSYHPLRGEGPLAKQLPQADILFKNMMHDIAFVDGGNRPDSLITLKNPDATDKEIRQIEAKVKRMAQGAIASVKAFVTRDIDWRPLSWAPKDLNTPEKLDRYERHIRSAFGHTESMADSTETNVASAVIGYNAQYLGGTIRPSLITDASELTDFLIPRFGYRPGQYFLCYDDPVSSDTDKLEARLRANVQAGTMTINQFREETGRDKMDNPGADDLRVNGVKIETLDQGPAANPNNPLAALFGGGSSSSQTGSDDGDNPDDGGESIPSDDISDNADDDGVKSAKINRAEIVEQIAKMIDDALVVDECPACGIYAKDAGLTGEESFDALIKDTFPKFTDDIKDILAEMESRAIVAIATGGEPDMSDQIDRAAKLMEDQFTPVIERMAEQTVSDMAALGVSTAGDGFVPESALTAYRDHVSRVASDIAASTETIIKPAVMRGIESGLTVDEVAMAIRDADVPAWRAETIARTEISEAMNGSRHDTMVELGIDEFDWMTAPSPSKAHAEIARRSPKKAGEPFVKAGEVIQGEKFDRDVYRPPARPRCRCRIEPHL